MTHGLVFSLTSADGDLLLIVATGELETTIRWQDNVFQGRVVCIRRAPHGVCVRALGLTALSLPALGLELRARDATDFEVLLRDGTVQWPRAEPQSATLAIRYRPQASPT
jgi:hypothetical protein